MPDDEYVDDPTIADDAVLWRRIRPEQWVHDEAGHYRPSSVNFKERKHKDGSIEPLSVSQADELPGPEAMLVNHPGYGVASITAGLARACGRGIIRDYAGGREPGHCLLFRTAGQSENQAKKNSEKLARASTWVIVPPAIAQHFTH